MRLKKGFTLAEILIVLMVIGVIATMTIPSMMKGVTEAQLKAGYKKAYNTIANFSAMERVSGALPSRGTAANIALMYQALNSSLSVKSYGKQTIDAGMVLQNNDAQNYPSCITATVNDQPTTLGYESTTTSCNDLVADAVNDTGRTFSGSDHTWIITEDNIAYTIVAGGRVTTNCDTKQELASVANDDEATKAACMVVIVDVNGLSKGPNTLEEQGIDRALTVTESLDTLTGDQYKIYMGIDGASPGPRVTTTTGRMMSDLK